MRSAKAISSNATNEVLVSDKDHNSFDRGSVINTDKKKKRKKQNKMRLNNEKDRENNDEQESKRLKMASVDREFSTEIPVVSFQSVRDAMISGKKKRGKKGKHSVPSPFIGEANTGDDSKPSNKKFKSSIEPVGKVLSSSTGSNSQSSVNNGCVKNRICQGIEKKKKKKKQGNDVCGEMTKSDVSEKIALNIDNKLKTSSTTSVNVAATSKKRKIKKKKSMAALQKEGMQTFCSTNPDNSDPVSLGNPSTAAIPQSKIILKKKAGKKKKKFMQIEGNEDFQLNIGNKDISTVSLCDISVGPVHNEGKKKKKKKANGGQMADNGVVTGESNVLKEENLTERITDLKHDKKRKKKKLKVVDQALKSNESFQSLVKASGKKTVTDLPPKLSSLYCSKLFKTELTEKWKKGSQYSKGNFVELVSEPFKCAHLRSFLQHGNFLEKVQEELSGIDFIKKNNDLYKFHQTSDLKNVSSPYISRLRNFLYVDIRMWLSDITGIELNETVDMSSSRYSYTDVLLCHDDELEGRRIAYILYLVPEWSTEDGGALDLFSTDMNGQPKDIVKSFLPLWNSFAFFEVSPSSFHQVNEILAKDKVRLSINGWFHGPNIKRPPKYIEPPKPLVKPVHFEQDELYSWINPCYLNMDTQTLIRKKFQNDSEIELGSFLSVEKYEELVTALQSKQLKWLKSGPANKQSCKVLDQENLPEILNRCCKFLQSEALFLILSQLTGLKLHHMAPVDSDTESDEECNKKDSIPGMTINIRKWSHGCYTLIRDGDHDSNSSVLDAMLFLHVGDGLKLKHGGFTSYIVKDEDEELLTVLPRSNCFALVYRDLESVRFTKYINSNIQDLGEQDNFFYDISCTYFE